MCISTRCHCDRVAKIFAAVNIDATAVVRHCTNESLVEKWNRVDSSASTSRGFYIKRHFALVLGREIASEINWIRSGGDRREPSDRVQDDGHRRLEWINVIEKPQRPSPCSLSLSLSAFLFRFAKWLSSNYPKLRDSRSKRYTVFVRVTEKRGRNKRVRLLSAETF